ncbi:MAG: hypothetical protein IKN54_00755 [Lachnospiraceae bacterium]|nr:hypothetical protein [Lachnospiraceae bacterium]
MKFNLTDEESDEILDIEEDVEEKSKVIDTIVEGIISPYCKDLDKYVFFIKDCLKDGENPPTTDELDDFCLNLSTYIYFAGGMCEQLGIRDDITKAVYKEMYHTARASQEKGTVADKDSLAELASQEQFIVSSSYTRAYKTMKAKVENAQELLSSVKKVLSHRIQEMELTRIGGSGK